MDEATPRITQAYLEQFTHRTVRIIGRVTRLRGDEASIDSAGQITLHLNRVSVSTSSDWMRQCLGRETEHLQESHLTMDHYVEVVGKVQSDLSIRVLASTDMGTSIGMWRLASFLSYRQYWQA
jgi:replication factor A3